MVLSLDSLFYCQEIQRVRYANLLCLIGNLTIHTEISLSSHSLDSKFLEQLIIVRDFRNRFLDQLASS